MIERSDIDHIATLARLAVNDGEAAELAVKLNNILDMVGELQALDTGDVAPMAHPGNACQRLRKDEVTEQNQREQLQQGAPATAEGLFLVPRVIEQAES